MAIIDTITPQDFKQYFKRGFIYASIWNEESIYNTNDVVFYEPTSLYYKCLSMNVSSEPTTIADWLALADKNYVLDEDIEKAFLQASGSFNQSLFSKEEYAKMVFLYLTAHYIVIDFQLQGLTAGGSLGIITSKSVSDVSVSYGYPQKILENPVFYNLAKTGYGNKAIGCIYPFMASASIGILWGTTTNA
jgi:hypothetical protein